MASPRPLRGLAVLAESRAVGSTHRRRLSPRGASSSATGGARHHVGLGGWARRAHARAMTQVCTTWRAGIFALRAGAVVRACCLRLLCRRPLLFAPWRAPLPLPVPLSAPLPAPLLDAGVGAAAIRAAALAVARLPGCWPCATARARASARTHTAGAFECPTRVGMPAPLRAHAPLSSRLRPHAPLSAHRCRRARRCPAPPSTA